MQKYMFFLRVIFIALLLQPTIHSMATLDLEKAFKELGIANKVNTIIATKTDPNTFSKGQMSLGFPLWWTCSSDEHFALSHQLLKLGANPNWVDPQFKFVSLENSITFHALKSTELLLIYGANPEVSHIHALCSPSSWAIPIRIALLKLLLEYGARIDIPNKSGQTPLVAARIHFPNSELVSFLESYKKNKIA